MYILNILSRRPIDFFWEAILGRGGGGTKDISEKCLCLGGAEGGGYFSLKGSIARQSIKRISNISSPPKISRKFP